MVNAQEYVNSLYPKEERAKIKRLSVSGKDLKGHLDLSGFGGLTELDCSINNLTSLDLSKNINLTKLTCYDNNFTSVDFLNTLPNPEKLGTLWIYDNKIQPTDIAIFSKFVSLEHLKIGTMGYALEKGKHNKFYGSFKSWKNLTKLTIICIEATDVNEGLEYLPMSLVEANRGGKYCNIECSPHNTQAKCSQIQDQPRPFNYDLEAWQLAHPEKMLISHPEYFTQEESKDKWIQALKNKVEESKQELSETEKEKVKRITRLETKIKELEQAKTQISQQTQTEFSTQNKSTQTDLTGEQINQQNQENQQLLKDLQDTKKELTNTQQQFQTTQEQLTTQTENNQEQTQSNNKPKWYQRIVAKLKK